MTETDRRVLVVEDEPLIRMLAVDMLEMLGFSVMEAVDGAEATAVGDADLQGLHAVVVDLGLPDMPGEQVIRALLERRPNLPVIVASGADASHTVARLGAQSRVNILEKPYQFKDLEQAMASVAPAG